MLKRRPHVAVLKLFASLPVNTRLAGIASQHQQGECCCFAFLRQPWRVNEQAGSGAIEFSVEVVRLSSDLPYLRADRYLQRRRATDNPGMQLNPPCHQQQLDAACRSR